MEVIKNKVNNILNIRIQIEFINIFLALLSSILYYFLIFQNRISLPLSIMSKHLLLIATMSLTYFSLFVIKSSYFKKYKTKFNYVVLILITLVISFCFVGFSLFLQNGVLSISSLSIVKFLLFSVLVIPYELAFIYIIEKQSESNIKIKRNENSVKTFFIFFLIIFSIWLIVLIAFKPGNIPSDAVDQWLQALGSKNITPAHPPIIAIVWRILFNFTKDAFIVLILQLLFISYVFARILYFFYIYGINKKKLIMIAIIFACVPTNFMFMTSLLKDSMYTVLLLLLTFSFLKLCLNPGLFTKNIYDILEMIFAIVFVYLYRYNGIGPLVFSFVALIILTFIYKKKSFLYIILISIILIQIITGPIYSSFNVVQTKSRVNNSQFMAFLIRSSGAVLYNGGELTAKEEKIVIKTMSPELLAKNFNHYNGDSYGWDPNVYHYRENSPNIDSISTKEVLTVYSNLFIRYPSIIVAERLNATELLWNILPNDKSFNHRYPVGVWFPSYANPEIFNVHITDEIDNAYIPKNQLTKIIRYPIAKIETTSLLDSIFFRSGIYVCLLMLTILFIFNNQKRFILLLFPLIGNTGTWILIMQHQSFRYVWYMQLITLFIILFMMFCGKNKFENKVVKKK